MKTLYPAIEPFHAERLSVDARHTLYVEQCGNPTGIPVVFLHGGPGAGLTPDYRRYFNPARFHIVLFDQRGAGRSTPFADLTDNTTWHLVADIEAIRQHLGIERWIVFGGSWGSTLALAYAETHPERCLALVLRGIFLGRSQEVRWYYERGGVEHLLPEKWERYVAPIPEGDRGHIVDAYWQRLSSPDRATQLAAAHTWAAWEAGGITLADSPATAGHFSAPEVALSLARTEAWYFRHHCFFDPPDQLLRNIGRVHHLPGVIIQGRYDLICPVRTAFELARAWPEAQFRLVLAGHAGSEPAIVDALVTAMDGLAERFSHANLRDAQPD